MIEHRAVKDSSDDGFLVLTTDGVDEDSAFYDAVTEVRLVVRDETGTLTTYTSSTESWIVINTTDDRLDIAWGQSGLEPGVYPVRVVVFYPAEPNGKTYLFEDEYQTAIETASPAP